MPLAPEPAADFHRHHIQLPHRHAQNPAGVIPQRKMPLTAGPDGYRAVRIPARRCRMRLNVPLMHLPGAVLPLHDGVRFGKPRLRVAQGELEMIGNVGTVPRIPFGPAAGPPRRIGQRNQPLVDNWRIRRHRLIGGKRRRQHFVIHIHQPQRFLGQMGRIGGDGGHRVAPVQRLFPRHHIAAVKAIVDGCPFLLVFDFRRYIGEIGGGNHGVHPRQRQRPAGVNPPDARMSVRTPQDLPVQHPRQMNVGGVARPPHHLVRPIVPHRPRADHPVILLRIRKHNIRLVVKHCPIPPFIPAFRR